MWQPWWALITVCVSKLCYVTQKHQLALLFLSLQIYINNSSTVSTEFAKGNFIIVLAPFSFFCNHSLGRHSAENGWEGARPHCITPGRRTVHQKGVGMLVGNFELNPQRRPIWAWPKLFLTSKSLMLKHRQYIYFYIFSRVTLNETFTAKYVGVLPRTP